MKTAGGMLRLALMLFLGVGLSWKAEGQAILRAVPERTHLYPAEPLRVTLVLTNLGDRTIEGLTFDPNLSGTVRVKPPSGDWTDLRPFMAGSQASGRRVIALSPQQSYRTGVRLDIASGCSGFVMTEPGDWEFSVTMRLEEPSLAVSSSVKVEIVQPPPHEQAALLAFLEIPDICTIMRYLNADASPGGEDTRQQIAAFARRYSSSRYAEYAWFCIARSMIPPSPFSDRRYTREMPGEALPIFHRLSGLEPREFSLVADALYYAAACYYRLEDTERATGLIEEALRRFPDAASSEQARRALRALGRE